jgi:hypothetical protein
MGRCSPALVRTNPVHFPSPQLVYGESISTPDARTVALGTFSACELDVHPHAPIRNPERWVGRVRFWPCSPVSSHRVPLAPPVRPLEIWQRCGCRTSRRALPARWPKWHWRWQRDSIVPLSATAGRRLSSPFQSRSTLKIRACEQCLPMMLLCCPSDYMACSTTWPPSHPDPRRPPRQMRMVWSTGWHPETCFGLPSCGQQSSLSGCRMCSSREWEVRLAGIPGAAENRSVCR